MYKLTLRFTIFQKHIYLELYRWILAFNTVCMFLFDVMQDAKLVYLVYNIRIYNLLSYYIISILCIHNLRNMTESLFIRLLIQFRSCKISFPCLNSIRTRNSLYIFQFPFLFQQSQSQLSESEHNTTQLGALVFGVALCKCLHVQTLFVFSID